MNWNNSENGESKSSGVNGVNNYAVCIFAFALKDLFSISVLGWAYLGVFV